MEIDKMIEMGWGLLEHEREPMEQTGGIAMKYWLMDRDEHCKVFFVPQPEMINDAVAKQMLTDIIRIKVKEEGLQAVFTIADAWIARNDLQTEADKELFERIERIGLGEAKRLGLCRPREALMCHINTPIETIVLHQFYQRVGGDPPKGRIEWEEKVHDCKGESTGRMQFFEQQDGRPQ